MSAEADFKRNSKRIVDDALDRLGRAGALEMAARLVRRTPVDTGQARANWNPSLGEPDYGVTDSTDQGLAVSRTSGLVSQFRLSRGDVFWLGNGLPYIRRLEDGWSRQAPSGMARITEREMKSYIETQARRLRRG